jgi:hypothetical protein
VRARVCACVFMYIYARARCICECVCARARAPAYIRMIYLHIYIMLYIHMLHAYKCTCTWMFASHTHFLVYCTHHTHTHTHTLFLPLSSSLFDPDTTTHLSCLLNTTHPKPLNPNTRTPLYLVLCTPPDHPHTHPTPPQPPLPTHTGTPLFGLSFSCLRRFGCSLSLFRTLPHPQSPAAPVCTFVCGWERVCGWVGVREVVSLFQPWAGQMDPDHHWHRPKPWTPSLNLEFDRGASATIHIDLRPKAYILKPIHSHSLKPKA